MASIVKILICDNNLNGRLREQPKSGDTTTGFSAKWCLEMTAEISYWWHHVSLPRSWLVPSRLSLSLLSGARGLMTPFSRRARYAKTTGDESDPDLSSASECNLPSAHDQSEALPRSGYWHLGMKFLQSFLRRHFTAKPVLVLFSQAIWRLSESCG